MPLLRPLIADPGKQPARPTRRFIAKAALLPLLTQPLLLGACAASRPPATFKSFRLPAGAEAISLFAESSGAVWWLEADGRRLYRMDQASGMHEAIAVDPPGPAGRLNMDRQGRLWLLSREGAPLLAIRVGDAELPSRDSPWRLDKGLPRQGEQAALDPGLGGFTALSAQTDWLWLAQPGQLVRLALAPQ